MKKILVVEDEKPLSIALTKKLKKEGFEVDVAGNGEEGLSKFNQFKPDLILLDIVMPVMDGLTMLEKLRETSDVPVIILTNLSSPDKIYSAIKSGSYEYLTKLNYSLEDVINKVKKILKS